MPKTEAPTKSFAGNLAADLGIEVLECTREGVKARMPVTERLYQPMGIMHGGASLVLAETVASMGGWFQVAEQGKVVVGMEINANHLRQVRSGFVIAQGTPLHLGGSSQVWEVKIFDEADRLVCISRCTLAVLTPR